MSQQIPRFADVRFSDAAIVVGGRTFDRWIIGQGADSDIHYVVHLSEPRFIAKIEVDDDGADPEAVLSPFAYALENGDLLFDFLWIDPAPTGDNLHSLMRATAEAIDRDLHKTDEI